jgi:hypothetical protein
MQGREIDLEKLASQNELVPAIGNMKVNARGDELGPGGQIIRRREDIVAEYYEDNPNARGSRTTPAPAPVVEKAQPAAKAKKKDFNEEE